MSEDPSYSDTRYNEVQKIGSSEDCSGRLADANTAFTYIPFIVNYLFNIFLNPFDSIVTLENAIHQDLNDLHIRKEFFRKPDDYSTAKRIQDFLDIHGVHYEFVDSTEARQIRPIRRKPKPKLIKVEPVSHTLRPEQLEAVEKMKTHRIHTFVFPTGFGKTVIFTTFLAQRQQSLINSERWLILVPTKGLVRKTMVNLAEKNIKSYSYKEKIPTANNPKLFVIVSTYQSSKKFKNIEFTGIIYDECHRTVLDTRNEKSSFQFSMKYHINSCHYYFTATRKDVECVKVDDISMDRNELFGPTYGLNFNEAVEKGYICDYVVRLYTNTNKEQKLVELFQSPLAPFKTIVFCSTIKEAEDLQKSMSVKLPRYHVLIIHSKQTSKTQKEQMNIFRTETNCILFSCDMVSVGFDQSDIDGIVHYNLSRSYIENGQRNGRSSRLYNYKRCSRIYYFIQSEEELKTVFQILGDMRPRLVYLDDSKENVALEAVNRPTIGSGRFTIECNIDSIFTETDIPRHIISAMYSNDSPNVKLQKLLRNINKNGIVLIDRSEAFRECKYLFDFDIVKECKLQANFPLFALPKRIFDSYCSTIETNLDKVRDIALSLGLNTSDKYKNFASHSEHRLPSYKFLVNGGLGPIGNLNDFLNKNQLDEN